MQVPTLATGLDGVESVSRFYRDGTDEVKTLLRNECTLIYECCFCRSLFRSIINFVAHKRTACRSLCSTVGRLEAELARQLDDNGMEGGMAGSNGQMEIESSVRSKSKVTLRRLNLATQLSKHIKPVRVDLAGVNVSLKIA